jgi:uncharacterized damage-inducible protein DinB
VKEILQQYSSYNLWANHRITGAISSIPDEHCFATVVNSFSSIQLTLMHIWSAESIWWQRLKLVEVIKPVWNERSSIHVITSGLLSQSTIWMDWVEKSAVAAFEHEFIYLNSKKEQFKQPVFQVLVHLFNHGTYHRGQLVTMLKQLGVENIPATDFIEWSRNKR